MKVYMYARKFATALIEVEENKEQLAQELIAIASEWSKLNEYIPMYLSDAVKIERLNQLGVMPVIQKLVLELSSLGMMRLLPQITKQYIESKNKIENTVVAQVTTKRALSEVEQNMLSHMLSRQHQKNIMIKEHINPDVIDGLKVEIDYHVFDDTVASKINSIIQQLSYEMEVV